MDDHINLTKAKLLDEIRQDWKELNAYLDSLSEIQMTTIFDTQDWSIKDHLIHLSIWEQSVVFFLQKKPRHEGLGIDQALFNSGSIDEINAVIKEQHKGMPFQEVRTRLREIHAKFMSLCDSLSDDDLSRPLTEFHPETQAGDDRLPYHIILDNTAGHFREHLPWIEALAPPIQ
jgi:hypothetical protein